MLVIAHIVLLVSCSFDNNRENGLELRIVNGFETSKTITADSSITGGNSSIDILGLEISTEDGTEVLYSNDNLAEDIVYLQDIVAGTYRFAVRGYISGGVNPILVAESTEVHEVGNGSTLLLTLKDPIAGNISGFSFKVYAPYTGEYSHTADELILLYSGGTESILSIADGTLSYIETKTDDDGTYWSYDVTDLGLAKIKAGKCMLTFKATDTEGNESACSDTAMFFAGVSYVGKLSVQKGNNTVATPVISEVGTDNIKVESNNKILIPKAQFGTPYDVYNENGTLIANIIGSIGPDLESVCVGNIKDKSLRFVWDYGDISIYIGSSPDSLQVIGEQINHDDYNGVYEAEIPSQLLSISPLYIASFSNGGDAIAIPNDLAGMFKNIQITCETKEAIIHYTIDGTEPTEDSPVYTDVFEVEAPATIKARAFKDGMRPSETVSYDVKKAGGTEQLPVPEGIVSRNIPSGYSLMLFNYDVYPFGSIIHYQDSQGWHEAPIAQYVNVGSSNINAYVSCEGYIDSDTVSLSQ